MKKKYIDAERDRMMRRVEAIIKHTGKGMRSWRSTLLTLFSFFYSNPRVRITIVDTSPDQSFKSRWDKMVEDMEKLGWKRRMDNWTPIRVLGDFKNLSLNKDYVMWLHPDLYCVRDLSDDIEEFVKSGAKALQSNRAFVMFKRSKKDCVSEEYLLLEDGELLVKDELVDQWGKDTLSPGAAFVHLGFDHKNGHDGRNAKKKRDWVEKTLAEMMEEFDEYEDEQVIEMAERGNNYIMRMEEKENHEQQS